MPCEEHGRRLSFAVPGAGQSNLGLQIPVKPTYALTCRSGNDGFVKATIRVEDCCQILCRDRGPHLVEATDDGIAERPKVAHPSAQAGNFDDPPRLIDVRELLRCELADDGSPVQRALDEAFRGQDLQALPHTVARNLQGYSEFILRDP